MEVFGPQHIDHARVQWPEELASVDITISTTFRQLLTHNNPPSETLRQQLKLQKQSFLQSVDHIDHEIDALYDRINALEWERARFNKAAFSCDVIMSPFRRLPKVVLHQIVQEAVRISPQMTDDFFPRNRKRLHPPSRLSQISKVVSNVVHAMPHLWKDIHYTWRSDLSSPGQINRIRQLSRLSGSLPIHIRFTSKPSDCRDSFDERQFNGSTINRLAEVLSWMLTAWEDRNRWKEVTIVTCSSSSSKWLRQFGESISQIPETNRPRSLQVLRLSNAFLCESLITHSPIPSRDRQPADAYASTLTQVLTCLPGVRYFSDDIGEHTDGIEGILKPVAGDVDSILDLSSWSKLTSINIFRHHLTPNKWVSLLKLCPNLQKGHFCIHPPQNTVSTEAPTRLVACPYPHQQMRLMHLQYFYSPRTQLQIFLPFVEITFPQLTWLDFGTPGLDIHLRMNNDTADTSNDPQTANAADFTAVFPALKHLTFRLNQLGQQRIANIPETLKFLAALPSLLHLKLLLSYEHVAPLMEFLAVSNDQSNDQLTRPLHHLQSLELVFFPGWGWSSSGLGADAELTTQFMNIRKALFDSDVRHPRAKSVRTPSSFNNVSKMTITYIFSSTNDCRYRVWLPEKSEVIGMASYFSTLQQKFSIREAEAGINVRLIDTKAGNQSMASLLDVTEVDRALVDA